MENSYEEFQTKALMNLEFLLVEFVSIFFKQVC
jgi:hypothetical protein